MWSRIITSNWKKLDIYVNFKLDINEIPTSPAYYTGGDKTF